jgi:hypothetical protein
MLGELEERGAREAGKDDRNLAMKGTVHPLSIDKPHEIMSAF